MDAHAAVARLTRACFATRPRAHTPAENLLGRSAAMAARRRARVAPPPSLAGDDRLRTYAVDEFKGVILPLEND